MKNKLTLLFTMLAILIASPIFCMAEEEIRPTSDILVGTDDSMDAEKILEGQLFLIDGVKPAYDTCVAAGNTFEKLQGCIWKKLPPKTKEQVSKLMEENKAVAKDKKVNQFDSLRSVDVKSNVTPAQKKLQEYLYQRLQEAIYGNKAGIKTNGQVTQLIKHETFLDIFETQLGKNIISAVTSYCFEADYSLDYIISAEEQVRKLNRKVNLDKLSVASIDVNGENTNAAYQGWSRCIRDLTNICHKNPPYNDLTDLNKTKATGKKIKKKDLEYSYDRSCNVVNYMKAIRQEMIAVNAIQKQNDKRESKYNTSSLGLLRSENDISIYGDTKNTESKDVNELTSISSNELVNTSGYKEALDEDAKSFKDCFDKNSKTILDEEHCKKYLNVNHDESNAIIARESLKLNALDMKFDNITSIEELKDLLKDEGFTDRQIAAKVTVYVEEYGDIQTIKSNIAKKFKHEKEALIKQMAARFKEKSSTKKDVIKGSEDIVKLEKIAKEFESRPEDLKEFVHYNNIVSAYLEVSTTDADGVAIKDDTGQKSSNTAGMRAELNDSAYLKDNMKDSNSAITSDPDRATINIEKLKRSIENTDLDYSKDASDDTQQVGAKLEVDNLNSIINDRVKTDDHD